MLRTYRSDAASPATWTTARAGVTPAVASSCRSARSSSRRVLASARPSRIVAVIGSFVLYLLGDIIHGEPTRFEIRDWRLSAVADQSTICNLQFLALLVPLGT